MIAELKKIEGRSKYLEVLKKAPNEFAEVLDLEKVVLGAMLLDENCVSIVIDVLKNATSFYSPQHQEIYIAITRLDNKSLPVDILTVTEYLKKEGTLDLAGGPAYLVELTNRVASAANIEAHCLWIMEKATKRKLWDISMAIQTKAIDPKKDALEMLDEVGQEMTKIETELFSKAEKGMADLAVKALRNIEFAMKHGTGITGIPSGFSALDRITAGFQNSDLILIGARPGMGKSAMMLKIALNAAQDFGHGVAVFSLEMSSESLFSRFAAIKANLSGEKIKTGQMDDEEYLKFYEAAEKLSVLPIFIDDTPGIRLLELRAKVRQMIRTHKISLVMIDYIQLITDAERKGDFTNREQEISNISKGLKGLAKELNIPIIALSQVSRGVETRSDKRPMLSDLRESGSLEQDSDIVMFLYRDEYYQILEDSEGNSTEGIAELIIDKHRNGSLGNIKLRFDAKTTNFKDYHHFEEIPLPGMEDAPPSILLK